MTESAKAVDTVFRRHGWKSTETMPIETHMAQALYMQFQDMPDHDYELATVQIRTELTTDEKIRIAIYALSRTAAAIFIVIGMYTFGRWVYGWMQ